MGVPLKVPKCYIRIKKDFRNHTSFKFFLGLDFSLFFGFYFPTQFNDLLGSRIYLREERKQLTNIALWGAWLRAWCAIETLKCGRC